MKDLCVFCIFFQCFTFSESFGVNDHDDISSACATRFEYRMELKKQYNDCSRVVELNPACGKKITVAYGIHPPYVYEKDGRIHGVLPTMLDYAFDSCCFGCQQIEYVGPHVGLSRFNQNATIVLPIQTASKMKQFFGRDFVHMLDINAVSVVGPRVQMETDKIMRIIINSIFSTWPLFATATLMAVIAGIIMWVLESGLNQDQFPHSFPRGPFEGFWWAVVSMTTVGYGDRSPRSVAGRIFAILWILIGIIIFSIFSATVTSSLTSTIIALHKVTLHQKKFAVIKASTVGTKTMMAEQAISKEYSTIEDIRHVIKERQVDGMAIDEYIANYYAEHMAKEDNIEYQLYRRISVEGICHGLISYDPSITRMLLSFYESNDDHKETMALMALGEHIFDEGFQNYELGTLSFIGTRKMLFSTLGFLVLISVLLVILGLVLKRVKERRNSEVEILCSKNSNKVQIYVEA